MTPTTSPNAMNIEKARFNMVEQQVRPWDVLDGRVLDLMASLPREQFVPSEYQSLAFADVRVPLGHGQEMMPPREEGRLLQALNVQPGDTALEVGTGSGYVTALLASSVRQVYSVDIVPEFITSAQAKLSSLNLGAKVTLEVGDASAGWDHYGPYDVIAITGSLVKVPDSFKRSLKIGGRLFCIEGDLPAMTAKLITRTGDQSWTEESLFETVVARLINAPQSPQFQF